jgi:hypothetical protein
MDVEHQQQISEPSRLVLHQCGDRLKIELDGAPPPSLTVEQCVTILVPMHGNWDLNAVNRDRFHQFIHFLLSEMDSWIVFVAVDLVDSNRPELCVRGIYPHLARPIGGRVRDYQLVGASPIANESRDVPPHSYSSRYPIPRDRASFRAISEA